MEGYEQLCRVRGTMAGRAVDGLGQRGHSWGNPDWDKIALTRVGERVVRRRLRVGALGGALGQGVLARRRGDLGRASSTARGRCSVDEPRLSTTTDAAGRQIRAGLEFWLDKDDDYPTRGLGEVVTGSTLELGALRLDVAFFDWHIEGRTAVGRYDIIRRG